MTNTVSITGNKTLGEGDDGTIHCVDDEATVTLPHEDTWKFKKEDEFTVVANSTSTIKVTGEEGVTIMPLSKDTIIGKGGGVNIKYQGDNTYLMWGIVCLIILIGFGIFTYNDTMNIIENGIIFVNGE